MHHIIPNCVPISSSNHLKSHMVWMWLSELHTKDCWVLHAWSKLKSAHPHTPPQSLCVCMCALYVHNPIPITPLLLGSYTRVKSMEWWTNNRDNSLDTLASDYNLIQCLKPYINPANSDSHAVATTEMPQFLFSIQCSPFLWCDPFKLKDNKYVLSSHSCCCMLGIHCTWQVSTYVRTYE